MISDYWAQRGLRHAFWALAMVMNGLVDLKYFLDSFTSNYSSRDKTCDDSHCLSQGFSKASTTESPGYIFPVAQ